MNGHLLLTFSLLIGVAISCSSQAASAGRPGDATAQAILAETAIAKGDPALASEALQMAVSRSGAAERFVLAWAGFCLDRFSLLESQMRATKRGEGIEMRIAAWAHPAANTTTESLLRQSANADPEQRGVWGELGVAQLELGMRTEAQLSLVEARRRDPQGPETLQLEALLAAGEQRWQAAEDYLSTIAQRSPAQLGRVLSEWPADLLPGSDVVGAVWTCLRDATVACQLVGAQPQGGQHLTAMQLYDEGRWEQLKALPPSADADTSLPLLRGVAMARTSDCYHAIPSLERGLKADAYTASFWLQVCYAGELASAEQQLNEAGHNVALHQLKGDVALRLRFDAATAQKEYALALDSKPKDPQLLARESQAYIALGDPTDAKFAALAALAVDPHEAPALQALARMAMDERDYADALTRLKQLASIQPKDGWTQVELGVAYGQLGHPAEAARALGPQLAAGYPDPKGALHAQLAAALRKLGRDAEAKQVSAEAAKLANAALEGNGQTPAQNNGAGNLNAPQ